MSKPMQAVDYAFDNRHIRAPKPFTPEDAVKLRVKSYLSKGWASPNEMRLPFTAEIGIELNGRKLPMLTPYVGGMRMKHVRERARKLKDLYPDAGIYITIPSKANTKK